MTLAEIAAERGVTPQRVTQIERRALERCKAWCKANGLALADLLPSVAGAGDEYRLTRGE